MRGNQIFFTDQTGLRRLEDTTILPGSVSFGGDAPLTCDYASTVDRVYVSVAAATTYIAVVNPDPFGLVTTFNNALPYQFNYLQYVRLKDRLYATQSDGANLNVRVINPNTNSIVGNFQFSTNAAHEFEGGLAYWPTHDELWIARQGDTFVTQSMQIYDATAFTFTTSFDLKTFVPNKLIYVAAWGWMVAAGVDFNTNQAQLIWFDPSARAVANGIELSTPFSATDVLYNPHTNELLVDGGNTLFVVSMMTQKVVASYPITSGDLQMSFNASNNKCYHPKSGTNSIDVFG